MKQQALFIHGGQTYPSYDAYVEDLKTFTVDPYKEKKKWRMTLGQRLGDEFEVLQPEMPNKLNAHYQEWKIWFDKHIPFLRDNLVLIGHSLGASFLIKYVSEEALPVSVQALYLISAPYFSDTTKEGGDFSFEESILPSLAKKVDKLVFYHSTDDAVVPISHFEQYKQAFSTAGFEIFSDRGHFVQSEFPELIEDIKRLG